MISAHCSMLEILSLHFSIIEIKPWKNGNISATPVFDKIVVFLHSNSENNNC